LILFHTLVANCHHQSMLHSCYCSIHIARNTERLVGSQVARKGKQCLESLPPKQWRSAAWIDDDSFSSSSSSSSSSSKKRSMKNTINKHTLTLVSISRCHTVVTCDVVTRTSRLGDTTTDHTSVNDPSTVPSLVDP
jgi:hypothetical protein